MRRITVHRKLSDTVKFFELEEIGFAGWFNNGGFCMMVQCSEEKDKTPESWLASRAGQNALSAASAQVKEVTAKLQEMRKIDSESIHKPFTV